MKESTEVPRSLKAFFRFSKRSRDPEPPIHADALNNKTLSDGDLQDLTDRTASQISLASTSTPQDYLHPNNFNPKNLHSTHSPNRLGPPSPNAVAHSGALISAPSTATQPNSSSISTLGLWDDINGYASRQSSYTTDVNRQFNTSAPSSPFALPCPATLQAYSFDTVITRTLSPIKVKPPPTQDPQTGTDVREASTSPIITCPEMLIAPSGSSLTMMSLGSQVGSNTLYSNPSDRAHTIIHSRSASTSSSGVVSNPNAYDPNAVGAVTAARMAAALMAEHHQSPQPSPNSSHRKPSSAAALVHNQSSQYYQDRRAATAAAAVDEEPDVYVSVPGMKRQQQPQRTSSKASESTVMDIISARGSSISSSSNISMSIVDDSRGQHQSARVELKGLLRTVYSLSADSSTSNE